MDSPCQYQRKSIKTNMENINTDVWVQNVKRLKHKEKLDLSTTSTTTRTATPSQWVTIKGQNKQFQNKQTNKQKKLNLIPPFSEEVLVWNIQF